MELDRLEAIEGAIDIVALQETFVNDKKYLIGLFKNRRMIDWRPSYEKYEGQCDGQVAYVKIDRFHEFIPEIGHKMWISIAHISGNQKINIGYVNNPENIHKTRIETGLQWMRDENEKSERNTWIGDFNMVDGRMGRQMNANYKDITAINNKYQMISINDPSKATYHENKYENRNGFILGRNNPDQTIICTKNDALFETTHSVIQVPGVSDHYPTLTSMNFDINSDTQARLNKFSKAHRIESKWMVKEKIDPRNAALIYDTECAIYDVKNDLIRIRDIHGIDCMFETYQFILRDIAAKYELKKAVYCKHRNESKKSFENIMRRISELGSNNLITDSEKRECMIQLTKELHKLLDEEQRLNTAKMIQRINDEMVKGNGKFWRVLDQKKPLKNGIEHNEVKYYNKNAKALTIFGEINELYNDRNRKMEESQIQWFENEVCRLSDTDQMRVKMYAEISRHEIAEILKKFVKNQKKGKSVGRSQFGWDIILQMDMSILTEIIWSIFKYQTLPTMLKTDKIIT